MQNITEKSVIYAPFNTTMKSEDMARALIQCEFGEITYSSKVREANRQYEYNYNGEVDNGMLIGAKENTPASQTDQNEEPESVQFKA